MYIEGKLTFEDMKSHDGAPLFSKDLSAEVVSVDLWRMLIEGELKSGGYRTVLLPTCFPDYVIKIENNPEVHQNYLEFETWHKANDLYADHAAKFMAPVKAISPDRRILVQERITRPFDVCDMCRPDLQKSTVPIWFLFNDPHLENFGFLGNQLVCIDYGFIDVAIYLRAEHIPFEEFAHVMMDGEKKHVDRSLSKALNQGVDRPDLEKRRKELDVKWGLLKSNSSEG